MKNKTKIFLILINFILLFALTSFSAFKEESYKKREGFYLKLAPVDPRSLMQGDYMILNYEITDRASDKLWTLKDSQKKIFKKGYIVAKLDKDNVAQFVDIVEEPYDDDSLLFISFKANIYNNIKINVDTFFFQEGEAHLYENSEYSKVVLVGNTLRLVGLVEKLPE